MMSGKFPWKLQYSPDWLLLHSSYPHVVTFHYDDSTVHEEREILQALKSSPGKLILKKTWILTKSSTFLSTL
jgi:hypothetical protein